jgi:CelD/BcsL family acetyltransferase involved in cellulose biosynthesis
VNEINSQQDQKINLQIVQGAEGISEFGKHWDDLFARVLDAPPYLSQTWVKTFIREGRIKGVPVFIFAFSGTKLVGLFPLTIYKFLNTKIAVPIGIGEAPYLGVLLDPDYLSVAECIADLITSKKLFDVYHNPFLSMSDTATNNLLAILTCRGYVCRQVLRSPCRYIQLTNSFDEYLCNSMSSRSRHTLRRKERRLSHTSDVEFLYYTGKDVTAETISRIAIVQEESWMKRRGAAVLGQKFYGKLLMEMAQAGLGCLWLMTINGADAAFQYAYVAHGKLYFRWTAFKLKYQSLSPGQSLMMHIIREACQNSILSIDFGPGDAEYKRFWCTNHFDVNRVIAGKGLMGWLITICYYCVWQLTKIRCLHSSYRRMKSILRRFRLKAATL